MKALFCLLLFCVGVASGASVQWDLKSRTAVIAPINERQAPLVNQSTRGLVGTGNDLLIGGFVIKTRTNVLVRGIGPSMAEFGITNPLSKPLLLLFRADAVNGETVQTEVARNTDWRQAVPQTNGPEVLENIMGALGAFALDRASGDTAIYIQLQPGVYTAQLVGQDGATGVGLLEIYLVPPEIDSVNPAIRTTTRAGVPAYFNQGLAPVGFTQSLWGVRLELEETTPLTVTYTAADFSNARPGVTLPTTVTYGTSWVVPMAPSNIASATAIGPGGMGYDSQGWDNQLFAGGKTAPSVLQIGGPCGNDVVAMVYRELDLTFTSASGGTYVQRVGVPQINADRSMEMGKVLGTSSGTFRTTRILEIVPTSAPSPVWAFWAE